MLFSGVLYTRFQPQEVRRAAKRARRKRAARKAVQEERQSVQERAGKGLNRI